AGEAAGNLQKIRAAVAATAGEVVTYGGELIDAVFHSHCGGHTENSEDAWSAVVPYLRGIPCPYCSGTRWSETVHEFTGAQFAQAVSAYVAAVPVSATGRPLLGGAVRTATGRLKNVNIAGETVTGRDLRAALNLPSTNVTWEVADDRVVFIAKGYGHGVGLCQYGADGMAGQGKTYREILQYYYTGVEVSLIPST
ncbi:MAG TPA: SpoIID/LytB domain-containing protein, partial [Firmicutes bacterium]|nr:SpoIID/LytB domain-containing protein [Bacillota bacterium]